LYQGTALAKRSRAVESVEASASATGRSFPMDAAKPQGLKPNLKLDSNGTATLR
jgi:hypothetical protein